MNDSDGGEGCADEIDPRVKDELDALNASSVEINKLETEIDKARTKFRMLLTESTAQLNLLHKKLGKAVDKARPYHEQLKEAKKSEGELQIATVKFQRANSLYKAAKETVALAEQRMDEKTLEDERPEFDSAWQEMMNHATMRFMESEKDKATAESEHQARAAEFGSIQNKMHFLEKDIPRSINRSRPYFDLKDHLETRLQQERQSVEDFQRALTAAKEIYRTALANLERISEEIHASRQQQCPIDLPPRTPGVGAEADSVDNLSINLDMNSLKSEIMLDEADVASLCSQDVNFILDFQQHDAGTASESSALDTHPLACSGVQATLINKTTSIRDVPPTAYTNMDPQSYKSQGAIPKQPPSTRSIDHFHSNRRGSGSNSRSRGKTESQSMSENSAQSVKVSPRDDMGLSEDYIQSSKSNPNKIDQAKSPKTSPREVSDAQKRGRPKDRRVQKLKPVHFPILQGLTETNKKMSPKLPEGRPRGQEIAHHSPSPVRKNKAGYFSYPEKKSHQGFAREIEGGENLFEDTNGTDASSQRRSALELRSAQKSARDSHQPSVRAQIDTTSHEKSLDQSNATKQLRDRSETQSIPIVESAINTDGDNLESTSIDRHSPRGEGEGSPSESQPSSCAENRPTGGECSETLKRSVDELEISCTHSAGLNNENEDGHIVVYHI